MTEAEQLIAAIEKQKLFFEICDVDHRCSDGDVIFTQNDHAEKELLRLAKQGLAAEEPFVMFIEQVAGCSGIWGNKECKERMKWDECVFDDFCRLRGDNGWKLRKCSACNGSGYYDDNGSPPCGACDGTGFERYKPEPPGGVDK